MNNRQIIALVLATLFGAGCTAYIDPVRAGNSDVQSKTTQQQQKLELDGKAQALLQLFKKNPVNFLNLEPPKEWKRNQELAVNPFWQGITEAEKAQIKEGPVKTLVEVKDGAREELIGKSSDSAVEQGRRPSEYNDQVENLVDNPDTVLLDLDDIDAAELSEGKLDKIPWSDYYWPIYQGTLGSRYGIEEYINLGSDWLLYFQSVLEDGRNLTEIWADRDQYQVNRLSPSEKYDLLLGLEGVEQFDANFARLANWNGGKWPKGYLTPHQWKDGQNYWNRSPENEVESWMGICHGWAPAAYVHDRPEKAIDVLAADGETKIKFYPADIKALTSFVWAKARTSTKFVGGRCNSKDPEVDEETGAIVNSNGDCYDTNPHTWHLAVINQIGVNKRSFVIDATYDYEVWNQPVYSYRYVYFNPETEDRYDTWQEAAVRYKDHKKNDNFAKHRKRKPYYLVGVAMEIEYVVETMPTHREEDSEEYDSLRSATYLYDLELDKEGVPFGGEWYSNAHPDFLWNIPQSALDDKEHFTRYDKYLDGVGSKWNGSKNELPEDWRQLGKRLAIEEGKPLTQVVEELIRLSQDD